MGNNLILKLQQLNARYVELKECLNSLERENSIGVSTYSEDIDSYKKIGGSHVVPIADLPIKIRPLVSALYEKYVDIYIALKNDIILEYKKEL